MRSYNPSMEVEISARLEMNTDGTGRVTSVYGELDMDVPPMPAVLESKYAILKLCEKGTRVPDVGKRQSHCIYYLWLTQNEMKQVIKEIEVGKQSSQTGASVQTY